MKKKLLVSLFTFCFLFLLILSKAFYIQILNRDKLISYSRSQFIRTAKTYPNRGLIYDRNMKPLALNLNTFDVFTIPKNNKRLDYSFRKLRKILKTVDTRKIFRKALRRNKFTWIARKIQLSEKQYEQIKKLKDIFIERSTKRYYPNHELLGQTLGFVGLDNKGLSGIEFYFDKILRGDEKIVRYHKDAKGRPVMRESVDKGEEAKNLVLSIDKEIQAAVEKFLKEGVDKHKAKLGGAAVINPENGEILAIANYPSFDPNIYRKFQPKLRKLSFVTDPFEPGSIFKSLTIASALENNIVNSDTNYYCERGKLKVGNHYITEAESKKTYEWLSVLDILKYSSNIGTTKIAFDLTYPRLKETMDKFDFTKKTGIEVPGESRGILNKEKNVSPLSLSNISFGQGIATTGIQMLSFYASLANGGYKVRPTLIKGDSVKKDERVLSPETVNKLTNMLIETVEDGTGKNARISLFKIAGKTSTAQKSVDGRYSGYSAGFIGYPVNVEKKFVVYVYVDEPSKGGYYGNVVAAPIFRKISEYILFKNKDFKKLTNENLISSSYSIDKINIKQSAKRTFKKGFVPNFIGMDKKSVEKIANSLSLDISIKGFGVVEEQYPLPNAQISKNTTIHLQFNPPVYE